MTSLTGRGMVVVGASSGIGRNIASALAGFGARLVLVGRRRERLVELLDLCPGGTVVEADITQPSACEKVVTRSVEALGQIDSVVFAAGASRLHLVAETAPADWDLVLRTNLVAPALIAGKATAHMAPGGVMAFLSSVVVGNPYRGLVPYGVSKAGLEELVRGMRVEHPGIRFTTITLGGTLGTEFSRAYDADRARTLRPYWIASGALPANSMHVNDVGALVAGVLEVLVTRPSLDCHDLVLSPAGPSLSIAQLLIGEDDAEQRKQIATPEEI
jgi:NAD(P)-dependent dehydrogenase (short-subunit alcohol dehydrogenase family)